jgi:acyl-CoA thioester hydrolase
MTEPLPATGFLHHGHHRIAFRVYYDDTDAGGIVYHANYFRFAERARTEWLRLLGFEQQKLRQEHGIIFVMRHAEIHFHKPAHLDDVLMVETHLQAIGRTSMTLRQALHCNSTSIAEITLVLVCVDGKTLKPVRFPDMLKVVFAT